MKTLNLYLCRNLGGGLLIAVAISTFVMLTAQFAKVFELLSRGVPFQVLLACVAYRIPQALSYTIPLGIFIAAILLFNKMSTENEMTAIRAGGISLWQIAAPAVMIGALLSVLCGYFHIELAPDFKYRSKWLVQEEGVKSPLMLIEEGRFVEMFDGYVIFVGKKTGDRVHDIHLYMLDDADRVHRKVDARSGELILREEVRELEFTLFGTTIETIDPDFPNDVSRIRRIKGERLTIPLAYGDKLDRKSLIRHPNEMRLSQLLARIRIQAERGVDITPLYVELHMRAALALSPFSFVLIAIPLGIRRPRNETNYGLAACFLVPLAYYSLITFFDTFKYNPEAHPELLMWLPNILCHIGGLVAIWVKR